MMNTTILHMPRQRLSGVALVVGLTPSAFFSLSILRISSQSVRRAISNFERKWPRLLQHSVRSIAVSQDPYGPPGPVKRLASQAEVAPCYRHIMARMAESCNTCCRTYKTLNRARRQASATNS